jgi:hypothetical protein
MDYITLPQQVSLASLTRHLKEEAGARMVSMRLFLCSEPGQLRFFEKQQDESCRGSSCFHTVHLSKTSATGVGAKAVPTIKFGLYY